jgi:hypothetical protein
MYPTWNKSEAKEIVRLGVKFGKTIPTQNKHLASNETDFRPKRTHPT